ncbi:MAG TPA: SEC-C metal-binding domain-containing protein [Thermoanaerobaculia bacterium]|jgi:hypothetical protein|nr:SEC-C metal-binding domain-containing protein [Thermoanaerobaculia bacterium]
MRVGRNETCPCGSGKKFKGCCEGKNTFPKGLIVLLVVLALIAGVAFIPRGDRSSTSVSNLPAAAPAPPAKPGPQPSGPVPPGKIWSVEHGHWHDAAAPNMAPASAIKIEQTSGAPLRPTVAANPQPAGPAPAGKVWSVEHGHWHDAPK